MTMVVRELAAEQERIRNLDNNRNISYRHRDTPLIPAQVKNGIYGTIFWRTNQRERLQIIILLIIISTHICTAYRPKQKTTVTN